MKQDEDSINSTMKETRVLILGANGMLGHKILQVLSSHFQVWGTLRGEIESFQGLPIYSEASLIAGVQAENEKELERAMNQVNPDWVINCIGVIKQPENANDHIASILINSLLPHRLEKMCIDKGAHLIHFSTDCVFSGGKGCYSENDQPIPNDFYGHSKLLGEVSGTGCITLRTSIVGRELQGNGSLIEWLLAQRGKSVRGYSRAIYTGLTTNTIARLMAKIIGYFPELEGIWHVSSEAISKYELIKIVNKVYGLDLKISKDLEFVCDRRLDSSRFRERTGFQPESWEKMIAEMNSDQTSYGKLQKIIKACERDSSKRCTSK